MKITQPASRSQRAEPGGVSLGSKVKYVHSLALLFVALHFRTLVISRQNTLFTSEAPLTPPAPSPTARGRWPATIFSRPFLHILLISVFQNGHNVFSLPKLYLSFRSFSRVERVWAWPGLARLLARRDSYC